MPKDQACLSESSSCAPSSKTAKDKSNSTTMLAIRDTKAAADSNRGSSRCSSEKDSGYSDGSDWQQTDNEDQRSNTSRLRATGRAEASHKGQSKGLGFRSTENPNTMSAKRDRPPVYIIKDMVLKQPTMTQTQSQMLLSNGIICGSPPVIVFEQPSFTPTTLQLRKPLPRTSSVMGKKTSSTYLPILNSYPRIAPHPSKKPPDKSSLNHESQNLSKRMCTELKTDETPVTRALPEQHHHKQPKLAVSHSAVLCSTSSKHCLSSSTFTTASTGLGSPSMSGRHNASSYTAARGLYKNITTSTHHRRFLNTVELLRQSGLLDITLRTKELLRQSNTTEQDISQLRQHTELLCQAASNPSHNPNSTASWEHLYKAMEESGCYPNLKLQQKLPPHLDLEIQPSDTNRPQAAESSGVPPSYLSTSVPEQSQVEQVKKLERSDKSPEKGSLMSPDSSTG